MGISRDGGAGRALLFATPPLRPHPSHNRSSGTCLTGLRKALFKVVIPILRRKNIILPSLPAHFSDGRSLEAPRCQQWQTPQLSHACPYSITNSWSLLHRTCTDPTNTPSVVAVSLDGVEIITRWSNLKPAVGDFRVSPCFPMLQQAWKWSGPAAPIDRHAPPPPPAFPPDIP